MAYGGDERAEIARDVAARGIGGKGYHETRAEHNTMAANKKLDKLNKTKQSISDYTKNVNKK